MIDAFGWTGDCRREATRLADLFPGLELGWSAPAEGWTAFTLRLETDPEIASALASVRTDVPGLDPRPPDGTVAVLGAAIDLPALDELVRGWAGAVHATPLRCPALAPLDRLADRFTSGLTGSLPGPLRSLRGVVATIDHLALASGTQAGSLAMSALVVVDQPDAVAWYVQGRGLIPRQPVRDGGGPVIVDYSQPEPGFDPMTMQIDGDRFGFTTGGAALDELYQDGDDAPPLMVLGYDPTVAGTFIAAMMSALQRPMPSQRWTGPFDYVSYALDVDDRGLVLTVAARR